MALDSSLYLAAAASPADIEAALLRDPAFAPVKPYRDVRRVSTDAALIYIAAITHHMGPWEDVAIKARLSVLMSCTDKERTAAWTASTVRTTMILLHAFAGDALFLHHDAPALMRKAGALTLDRSCGLWAPNIEPDARALVDLPHSFGIVAVD